jgi:hypothetical protein
MTAFPTPKELDRSPELAVLVILDSALEVAACALQVAHPEIDDDPECPYWVARPDRRAAERLLTLADRLRSAIARYREALPEESPVGPAPEGPCDGNPVAPSELGPDSDDDIPF